MISWLKRLLGGDSGRGASRAGSYSRPGPRSTAVSPEQWLRGSSAETAYLFGSMSEYFNTAAIQLKMMGYTRSCSVSGVEGAMIDKWQSEDGRVVYVGYKS